jgi:hypothetical protein
LPREDEAGRQLKDDVVAAAKTKLETRIRQVQGYLKALEVHRRLVDRTLMRVRGLTPASDIADEKTRAWFHQQRGGEPTDAGRRTAKALGLPEDPTEVRPVKEVEDRMHGIHDEEAKAQPLDGEEAAVTAAREAMRAFEAKMLEIKEPNRELGKGELVKALQAYRETLDDHEQLANDFLAKAQGFVGVMGRTPELDARIKGRHARDERAE